jgi:hypothetical protein
MNKEFSPVVLWLELSQCCKDIITIIFGVKGAPLRKCHDQEKSNGFHAMVAVIFRSWIVCLTLSGGVSLRPSTATSLLQRAWAESRFVARNKRIGR